MAASSNLTPEQRATRSRLGAYALHSKVDSAAHLAPARAGMVARFEREVDPDGILDPAERARRVAQARKAFYTALALKSSRARSARTARSVQSQVDEEKIG